MSEVCPCLKSVQGLTSPTWARSDLAGTSNFKKMIKLEILGAAANWSKPFQEKKIKKFTSAFFRTDYQFQIDAGNPWDKRKIDYLIISHLHQDHISQIKTYPKKIVYLLPSKTFLKVIPRGVKFLIFKKEILIGKTRIKSFGVYHSSKTKTFGFKIYYQDSSFLWLPDYFAPFNYSSFKNCHYWFLGASSFKRNISHSHRLSGHQAILKILEKFRKKKIFPKKRKIFLIHLGLSMFPLKEKISILRKNFPEFEIQPTFDGMKINL